MNEEIKDKSYYAVIPAIVRYDKELTANAKLLYGEITALSNEKGYCWANNTYFAGLYNTSNRSISNWISQLVKKKYISIQIIYKDNSKCIIERRLKPIEDNFYTVWNKSSIPNGEKILYPIEEKFQDNNTINIKSNNNIYGLVVDYLNEKCKTNYRAASAKTKSLIDARVNEGYKLEDFKKVIDIKAEEWLNTDMAKYLRPITLFGTKFEGYLNQKNNLKKGSDMVGKFGNRIKFEVPKNERNPERNLDEEIAELGLV